jgi:transcription elongation GreA/GreB family factor
MAAELPVETNPKKPLDYFVPADVVKEMEAACSDATGFLGVMQQNERTRRSWWEYKHSSGQKRTQAGFVAKPYNGAADHDVFLTQAVLNKRNAMRLAAVSAGALSVTPTEATDSAQAALMKQVLRYYLAGPMKSEMLTQAVRAGSYADRYRFSLMYVGWKEERGVEPVKITFQQLVGWWQQQQMQQMTANMEGMQELPEMPDYTAEVVDPAVHHRSDQVFLGATVMYVEASGTERTVTILGIDEADSLQGQVSWISPIARTLLKSREGDELKLVSPAGVIDIEVLKVSYPAAT